MRALWGRRARLPRYSSLLRNTLDAQSDVASVSGVSLGLKPALEPAKRSYEAHMSPLWVIGGLAFIPSARSLAS